MCQGPFSGEADPDKTGDDDKPDSTDFADREAMGSVSVQHS